MEHHLAFDRTSPAKALLPLRDATFELRTAKLCTARNLVLQKNSVLQDSVLQI
jgi:hypothetical protein